MNGEYENFDTCVYASQNINNICNGNNTQWLVKKNVYTKNYTANFLLTGFLIFISNKKDLFWNIFRNNKVFLKRSIKKFFLTFLIYHILNLAVIFYKKRMGTVKYKWLLSHRTTD